MENCNFLVYTIMVTQSLMKVSLTMKKVTTINLLFKRNGNNFAIAFIHDIVDKQVSRHRMSFCNVNRNTCRYKRPPEACESRESLDICFGTFLLAANPFLYFVFPPAFTHLPRMHWHFSRGRFSLFCRCLLIECHFCPFSILLSTCIRWKKTF